MEAKEMKKVDFTPQDFEKLNEADKNGTLMQVIENRTLFDGLPPGEVAVKVAIFERIKWLWRDLKDRLQSRVEHLEWQEQTKKIRRILNLPLDSSFDYERMFPMFKQLEEDCFEHFRLLFKEYPEFAKYFQQKLSTSKQKMSPIVLQAISDYERQLFAD